MQQMKRILALTMCTVIAMSGTTAYKDKPEAVYSISGTMSGKSYVTQATSTTGSVVSDPYYKNQWALNNDGTFTYDTDQNITEDPWEFFVDPDFQIPDFITWPSFSKHRGSHWFNYHSGIQKNSSFFNLYQNQTKAVADVDIDAQEAWNAMPDNGKQVIVAVIDTGIDYTHEDLKDAIWVNPGEIAGDGIDNDKNGYIDDVYGWDFYNNKAFTLDKNTTEYEHATHVAGIMAASLNNTGIAGAIGKGNIKLMNIKALGGNNGKGDVQSVISAIGYAKKMGASICNLSFGTENYDEDLKQAIKDSNMLFVCAAGNGSWSSFGDDTDQIPCYPASYDLDNVISVANLTYDGTLDLTSNYGKNSVDLAAPGSYILSTLPGNDYGYLSGTSMAAPYVSSVAALVYSEKDIKLTDVKGVLLSSVKKLSSLKDEVASGGMVDEYKALTSK